MRFIALVLACLVTQTASAHPNDPKYWSLRTLVRTSDSSVQIVAGLEIPLAPTQDDALRDLRIQLVRTP